MALIWKFPIQVTAWQSVMIPAGSQVLSCQFQREQLCLWALVDPEREAEERTVYVVGTGHGLPDMSLGFIGTVQMLGGSLIFHVFMKT